MMTISSIVRCLREMMDLGIAHLYTPERGITSIRSGDMHKIEPNLYLGDMFAASDLNTLRKHGITHLLTVETHRPFLPEKHLKTVKHKHVEVDDSVMADLLSHFDETYKFICDGVQNGKVLVHCFMGISRSATVVIAYIMKKYDMPYQEAFKKVQSERKCISPNSGFRMQLELYQEMGYVVDGKNNKYKIYQLRLATEIFLHKQVWPKHFDHVIKPDLDPRTLSPNAKVFACKNCSRSLASENNWIMHTNYSIECNQKYFLEPMKWMNATNRIQGNLTCPKCKDEVGSFNWVIDKCQCGVEMAPMFYLLPSKVEMKPSYISTMNQSLT